MERERREREEEATGSVLTSACVKKCGEYELVL